MNERKRIGEILKLCQIEIERVSHEIDTLEYQSPTWHWKSIEHAMLCGKSDGIKAAAHLLKIIDDEERYMFGPDLINRLMK